MSVIRLFLLLVVLGGLSLLLVQNWSPVPLMFLGLSSQPIPVAIWILISLGAGVSTSLFIAGFLNLASYFARPKQQAQRRNVQAEQPRESTQKRYEAPKTSATRPEPEINSTDETFDDWTSNASDDWDFDDETNKAQTRTQDNVRDSTTYEVTSKPQSGSRSGSSYSYSYKEPRNSGVGKTESVYDADFRVIVPPYKQTETDEDDEDWGFDDDDEEQKK